MASDAEAMAELRARDDHDDRPTSGYNQTFPDGTTFALGYSNERGLMFFSRDLTVTQMRAWAPGKIGRIIAAVEEVRRTLPVDMTGAMLTQTLKGIPTAAKELIGEVAGAVIQCRADKLSEIPLPRDSLAYYHWSSLQHR